MSCGPLDFDFGVARPPRGASGRGKVPNPAARLLAIAHTNSQRLVRLIDDILDIEKSSLPRRI